MSASPTTHDADGVRFPVSGAWAPDQPLAERRFFEMDPGRPFVLEGGGVLTGPTIAYETWGELDASGSNAVLVCHALTGDAHAHGEAGPGQPTEGWWNDLIGPGKAIDTDRFFVVCANALGGCQGTTGPSSIDPATGRPFGSTFPVVTIRDIVRSQSALAGELGIRRWSAVVGGSMGGMQAIEWAVTYPDRVGALCVVASAAAASPQQIAWSAVGRQAIVDDPQFRGGDYYDAAPGEGPHRGLINARKIAMIHYRSYDEFARRFDRNSNEPLQPFRLEHRFDVESYLQYHGEKLVHRFDANTYMVLNKCMDLHDVGRGRGGIDKALERVTAPSMVMSVRTDFLYPRTEQLEIYHALKGRVPVEWVDIDSDNGHDGFLTEPRQVSVPLSRFLDEHSKT